MGEWCGHWRGHRLSRPAFTIHTRFSMTFSLTAFQYFPHPNSCLCGSSLPFPLRSEFRQVWSAFAVQR